MPDIPTAAFDNRPIGVFDSGIGGLTVAQAVLRAIPDERMVYFGDTAHLPYGDKSTAAIQAYSVKICDLLLRHGVKAILIACNSASAAAYDLVREYVGSRAVVMNVIDPVVDFLGQRYQSQKVGLIGTKQTVGSNVYLRKVHQADAGIELVSLATPLLAPMIEEGFANSQVSQAIVDAYLDSPELEGIRALVLACTHYPLILPQLQAYYATKDKAVQLIDPSVHVAERFAALLTEKHLLAAPAESTTSPASRHHFYVSDYTASFAASTRLFFGAQVELELYRLWE